MMEAVINDSFESEAALAPVRAGGFASKWSAALNEVNKPTEALERYVDVIYKKYRIPMIHPTQIEASHFDDLSFAALHAGYRDGWMAFELLYDGLGHPHDQDSWATMCRAHEVPTDAPTAATL